MLPLVDWEEKEALAAAQHNGSGSVSQAGKQCSGASGERLQVGGSVDPALHSFVQRSWLPDRRHFDHYCNERVDVWAATAERDRQRDEHSRLTRRGEWAATQARDITTSSRRASDTHSLDSHFDRTVHAFTTAPAFGPLL